MPEQIIELSGYPDRTPRVDRPDLVFHCPNPECQRPYRTVTDCDMYNPPDRPLFDGLRATVVCQCVNPATEELTQFEVILASQFKERSLIERITRRGHNEIEWTAIIGRRNWQ